MFYNCTRSYHSWLRLSSSISYLSLLGVLEGTFGNYRSDHPGHLYSVWDVQEFVWTVCVRVWTQGSTHYYTCFRPSFSDCADQWYRASLGHRVGPCSKNFFRRLLYHFLEPRLIGLGIPSFSNIKIFNFNSCSKWCIFSKQLIEEGFSISFLESGRQPDTYSKWYFRQHDISCYLCRRKASESSDSQGWFPSFVKQYI